MRGFIDRGGLWVAAQVVIFGLIAWSLRFTVELPGTVAAVGWALAVAGVGLALGGLVGLGPNLTPYPEPVAAGRLVERGVYRIVRHPIYGGLCIAAAGLALARGSPAAMGLAVGLSAFFWLKAGGEERRLETAYPEYGAYRDRVPARLVPWLL